MRERGLTKLLDVVVTLKNLEGNASLLEEDAEGQAADTTTSNQYLGLACVVWLKVHRRVVICSEHRFEDGGDDR